MSEFEGMFEGMDREEVEKMLQTHPLTVFSRLAHDDPSNKVYQQCLAAEIDEAATTLMENLNDLQFSLLEHVLKILPERNGGDDEAIRINVIRKVIAEVRRRKELEK